MFGTKELAKKNGHTALTPWKPLREVNEFRNLMSRALEDFFSEGRESPMDILGGRMLAPAVDVEQTDKEYIFEVELPGLEKNDFKVEMQDGTLIISGERKEKKEEKGKNFVRHEQYFGEFRRAFSMPADAKADGIKAAYKSGILTITVPRSEKAKPKAIPVDVE